MKFHILTLFPEMVMNGLGTSITGRAMASGAILISGIIQRISTGMWMMRLTAEAPAW